MRWLILLIGVITFASANCPEPDNTSQHFCGNCLSDSLQKICKRRGFTSQFSAYSYNGRLTGIVEECCYNPCTLSQLRQYCMNNAAKEHEKIKFKRKRSQNSLPIGVTSNKILNPEKVRPSSNKKMPKRGNGKRSTYGKNLTKKDKRRRTTTTTKRPETTTKVPQPEFQYIDDGWMDTESFYFLNHRSLG